MYKCNVTCCLTPPPLSQTVTPSRNPFPLERDVLYGRPFCSKPNSFILSGYFYSASSSPVGLLLGGVPDYSFDTVSEVTHRSAKGNCECRSCPRSLLRR